MAPLIAHIKRPEDEIAGAGGIGRRNTKAAHLGCYQIGIVRSRIAPAVQRRGQRKISGRDIFDGGGLRKMRGIEALGKRAGDRVTENIMGCHGVRLRLRQFLQDRIGRDGTEALRLAILRDQAGGFNRIDMHLARGTLPCARAQGRHARRRCGRRCRDVCRAGREQQRRSQDKRAMREG